MAESGIFHAFVSGVPDDPSFAGTVQPQAHWNAEHILTGGNNGEVLTRNTLDPSGWSWTPAALAVTGALVRFSQGAQSVASVASPTVDIVNLTFPVIQPTSKIFLLTQASMLDANGAVFTYRPGGLFTFLNNAALFTVGVHNSGVYTLLFTPLRDGTTSIFIPTGTGNYTLKGRFTGVPNMQCTLQFYVLEFS